MIADETTFFEFAPDPALLHKGENVLAVEIHQVTADANNKFVTTYFRKRFQLPDADRVSGLQLRLLRDDEAAVSLNGTEILRDGLPGGAAFNTLAANTAGGLDEFAFQLYSAAPAARANTQEVALTVIETDTDNDGMDDDDARAFGLIVGIDDAGDDFRATARRT